MIYSIIYLKNSVKLQMKISVIFPILHAAGMNSKIYSKMNSKLVKMCKTNDLSISRSTESFWTNKTQTRN